MAITFNRSTGYNYVDGDSMDYYLMKEIAAKEAYIGRSASAFGELRYYQQLSANLKDENRILKRKVDNLNAELQKRIQEYDELLEEMREC